MGKSKKDKGKPQETTQAQPEQQKLSPVPTHDTDDDNDEHTMPSQMPPISRPKPEKDDDKDPNLSNIYFGDSSDEEQSSLPISKPALALILTTLDSLSTRPDLAGKAILKQAEQGLLQLSDILRANMEWENNPQYDRSKKTLHKILAKLIEEWPNVPTPTARPQPSKPSSENDRSPKSAPKEKDQIWKSYTRNMGLPKWSADDPYTTLTQHVRKIKQSLDWPNADDFDKEKMINLFGASFEDEAKAEWDKVDFDFSDATPDQELDKAIAHVRRATHTTAPHKLLKRFATCQQKQKKMATFVSAIKKAYRRNQHLGNPIPDQTAVEMILTNLRNTTIRDTLRVQDIPDVHVLFSRLSKLDDQSGSSGPDSDTEKKDADPLAAIMVARIAALDDAAGATTDDLRVCQDIAHQHPELDAEQILAFASIKTRRCFRCKSTDHLIRDCPQRPNGAIQTQQQQQQAQPTQQQKYGQKYHKYKKRFRNLQRRVYAIELQAGLIPNPTAPVAPAPPEDDSDSMSPSDDDAPPARPMRCIGVAVAARQAGPARIPALRTRTQQSHLVKRRVTMIAPAIHALTNRKLNVLMDTGAAVNVITAKQARRLRLPLIPYSVPLTGLKGITHTSFRTTLPIRFTSSNHADRIHRIEMLVFEGSLPGADAIIGDGTLEEWNAILKYGTNPCVLLQDGEKIRLTKTSFAGQSARIAVLDGCGLSVWNGPSIFHQATTTFATECAKNSVWVP